MKGLNYVYLIGNMTRDPEVRHSQSGTTIANTGLAVNERRKVNGEWKDHAEFINLVAFGRTAEILNEYTSKGSPIAIVGRMQTRKWEDRDGNTRYSTEVVVNELVLLGGKPQTRDTPSVSQESFDPNDDIPF